MDSHLAADLHSSIAITFVDTGPVHSLGSASRVELLRKIEQLISCETVICEIFVFLVNGSCVMNGTAKILCQLPCCSFKCCFASLVVKEI